MKRIVFLRVPEPQDIVPFIESMLHLTKSEVEFLIDLGAIYVNFKRTTHKVKLSTGDILRVHRQPRRFFCPANWNPLIHFENENFVIVKKPAGLPTQASLDNRRENVHYLVSHHLNIPLYITHRLDVGTSGFIYFAKSPQSQIEFNQLLEKRNVTKIYRVRTRGPKLPTGQLHHWMKPDARAPKQLTDQPHPDWKPCELDILTSTAKTELNEYTIQLLTGRTHQIRAQMSHELNPVIGDQLYGSSTLFQPNSDMSSNPEWNPSMSIERYDLECITLDFKLFEKQFCFTHSLSV